MRNIPAPCCEILEGRLLMDGFSGPDLVAVTNDAVIPSTIVPGEVGNVRVSITNQGDVAAQSKSAANPIFVRLYLSLDDNLDQGTDILLGEIPALVNIGPGKTSTATIKVLVPFDAAASDHYRLITQVDTTAALTVEESDVLNNVTLAKTIGNEVRLRTVAWQFGGFAGRTNVPLTLPGNDGKAALFRLAGPGYGVVTPSATSPDGKISYDVTIMNSTTATMALFNTGTGSGVVLGKVDVQSPIKSLSMAQLALVGDLTIDGSCTTLTLGDVGAAVGNDLDIIVGAGKGLTVSMGTVGNVQFTSASPIKSFTATNWLDSDGSDPRFVNDNADTFTAPSLTKMTIGHKGSSTAGDFQADVVITGPAAKTNVGSVSIAGSMAGDWTISGSLKTMTVTGAAKSSTVRTTGSMSTLTFGACINSNFLAGIAANVAAKPTAAADFVSAATIGSFTVNGYDTGDDLLAQFFSNTNISADRLGKVSLTTAHITDLDNGGTAFGLYVRTTVTQLSCTDLDSDFSWTWKPKNVNKFPAQRDLHVTVLNV